MARIYVSKAGGGTVYDSANAKKIFISAIRSGFSVEQALKSCGKAESTYAYWRKTDPDFRKLVEEVRQTQAERRSANAEEIPPFPEFSEKYLDTKLFRHQLQWYDLLEGREPRDLHPAQIYAPAEPDMVLINTPPEHSKSTTVTVNYVTWRICQDPNIRVLIVSKTQDMAKKFLLSIKERLAESDTYYELQTKFGPPGGFAEGSASWTADRIYVAGRESGEKDPTVQALGIKGHIYGSRADLVILDDCVDHTNHGDYVKQIDWLQNMVMSRVADAGGKMVIVGTRIETTDLYSEILKAEYYGEEVSPWTYLTQPAVLEYGDSPREWVTLWPLTNRAPVSIQGRKAVEADGWPREGLWPMWTGPALGRKRARMTPRNWSLVYQQEQVADDQVFSTKDVIGCIDEQRYAGRLVPGVSGHRQHGMEGLFIVAGLDPADVGNTAAVVVGLDRQTGVRWVLDVYNKRGTRPHELRELIRSWTDRYRIAEWRIEKNAFQGSILQDDELKTYLYGRGCVMTGHFTGSNKWESNYGVSSMATLFHGSATGNNMIRLPSRYQSEGARKLVEELTTWNPIPAGTRRHTQAGHWDTTMALWFAEIRCREIMQGEGSQFHLGNEFLGARDQEDQFVIDVDFALTQGGLQPWDGKGW
jgi:terminase large subunit-like protein